MDEERIPELGTPEAAVRSCVNLIAAMAGQREQQMAFWLDLYYQVRLAYEKNEDPDPRQPVAVIRKEDVMDVMRELLQELGDEPEPEQTPSPAWAPLPKEAVEIDPKKRPRLSKLKKEVADNLRAARTRGVTMAAIADASGVPIGTICSILEGRVLPPADYRRIAKGLMKLDEEAGK